MPNPLHLPDIEDILIFQPDFLTGIFWTNGILRHIGYCGYFMVSGR